MYLMIRNESCSMLGVYPRTRGAAQSTTGRSDLGPDRHLGYYKVMSHHECSYENSYASDGSG